MELERIEAALKALPFEVAAPDGRSAAVAVVFVEAPLRVLFIRRAESERDPWSGQMARAGHTLRLHGCMPLLRVIIGCMPHSEQQLPWLPTYRE